MTARVIHADCLDALRELPDGSVHAVVTDPPYSLSFMGKSWDEHSGFEDAGVGYWLAGFIDGEGCFIVKGHARGTYAPSFTIKLRRDDRAALVAAQKFVGAGTIADVEGDGVSSPQVRWSIQDREGCQRLVDVLDKYPLRAKKRLDYLSWREAVCEWTDRPRGNRWHGAADQTRMLSLRERTSDVKAYTDVPWSGNEFQDWCRLWAAECLRVLTPGGHLLAFGGTRTWHRLACAIEDAGFEVRDSIAWLYGSGFPKSLDVSKAIDKAAGAEREPGRTLVSNGKRGGTPNAPAAATCAECGRPRWGADYCRCARDGGPATPDAERWQGWGTALKPAHEPIVVARKPLVGTVAANVLAHGTGGLNVDGCRVGFVSEADEAESKNKNQHADFGTAPGGNEVYGDYSMVPRTNYNPPGRWPANVVLDEFTAAEVDAQSGISGPRQSGWSKTGNAASENTSMSGPNYARAPKPDNFIDTGGGASRFFYQAKASSRERPTAPDGTKHPTVKPLALMRWLVRLVTPPGGVVLDPFAGSGTTVEAALLEGFDVIGIEREADYLPLIQSRIDRAATQAEEPAQLELDAD